MPVISSISSNFLTVYSEIQYAFNSRCRGWAEVIYKSGRSCRNFKIFALIKEYKNINIQVTIRVPARLQQKGRLVDNPNFVKDKPAGNFQITLIYVRNVGCPLMHTLL